MVSAACFALFVDFFKVGPYKNKQVFRFTSMTFEIYYQQTRL